MAATAPRYAKNDLVTPRSTKALQGGPVGPPPTSGLTRLVVVVVIVGIVTFFMFRAPVDPPVPESGADPSALAPAASASAPPPRCRPGKGGYRLGEAPADADPDAGPQRLAPFAVEVSRGVVVKDGFAVGVKHTAESGVFSAVALVDQGAQKGELVALARSRGDMDAPLVANYDDSWVAATLEPNASGLSLRLAKHAGGSDVAWGAEIAQGRDESLAYDMAFGERVGVVVWDDVTEDGSRSMIMLATVAKESLEGGERALAVSSKDVDAEIPRVALRDGGFWVAWVARVRERKPPEDDPDAGRYAAESIAKSWIELAALDEDGAMVAAPRAVTDKDGHVLAFDLDRTANGAALLAWRDDDTPSGAQGGKVTAAAIGLSGGGTSQLIAEDNVGAGVPNLLAGWLALSTGRGGIRVAPIEPAGELTGELIIEPAFGIGQVLAAHLSSAAEQDTLLIAKPDGKSVELHTVNCQR